MPRLVIPFDPSETANRDTVDPESDFRFFAPLAIAEVSDILFARGFSGEIGTAVATLSRRDSGSSCVLRASPVVHLAATTSFEGENRALLDSLSDAGVLIITSDLPFTRKLSPHYDGVSIADRHIMASQLIPAILKTRHLWLTHRDKLDTSADEALARSMFEAVEATFDNTLKAVPTFRTTDGVLEDEAYDERARTIWIREVYDAYDKWQEAAKLDATSVGRESSECEESRLAYQRILDVALGGERLPMWREAGSNSLRRIWRAMERLADDTLLRAASGGSAGSWGS